MHEPNNPANSREELKMEIREVFTLRLQDRALLEALQDRLSGFNRWGTRSDMVRAGLWQLTSLNDEELDQLLQSMGVARETKQAV